jgi:hypothetical protein
LTTGYATVCSTVWERKMFPRVACSGLMAGNVTDWHQSMSGFSGVAYPSLRLVEGIVTHDNINEQLNLMHAKTLGRRGV